MIPATSITQSQKYVGVQISAGAIRTEAANKPVARALEPHSSAAKASIEAIPIKTPLAAGTRLDSVS